MLAILLTPLFVIFDGWVIELIWNWFVPRATGWPRISVAVAVGLSALVSVLRLGKIDLKREAPPWWLDMTVQVAQALVLLVIAWFAHLAVV